MSALKNWSTRIILGSAMVATGGGGWWWLKDRPPIDADSSVVEAGSEINNPDGAPAQPQPIPISASTDSKTFSTPDFAISQSLSSESPRNGHTGESSPAFISNNTGDTRPTGRATPAAWNSNEHGTSDDRAGDAPIQPPTDPSIYTATSNSDDGAYRPPSQRLKSDSSSSFTTDRTNDAQSDTEVHDQTTLHANQGATDLNSEDTVQKPGQNPTEGPLSGIREPTPLVESNLSQTKAQLTDRFSDVHSDPSTKPGTSARQSFAKRDDRAALASNTAKSRLANPALALPASAIAAVPKTASVPGDRQLEGAQNPQVSIEKIAPDEIQVGKPAVFEIYVRNEGKVPAFDVVVSDQVPQGTRLIDVSPECTESSSGLAWTLGTLEPGKETKITLQVMPESEGEIGSVAEVEFRAQASVRTICTKPQLNIEHKAPQKVLVGDSLTVGITLSNPGTGAATGVVMLEDVPEGLSHPAGSELEYEVGTLRPGETRNLNLELRAEKPGIVENVIVLRGEGDLVAEHRLRLEVVAPQLQVGVRGPTRRFLDRQVTFDFSVANPGTAPAQNVDLVAHLPKGLEFVSTDNKGQYDPRDHSVYWSLEELAPGDSGTVQLVATPIEPGDQRVRIEGSGDMGLESFEEHVMVVEHTTELVFSVTDTADPIEVGAETVYEIHIANNGAKPVTNIRMTAAVSADLEVLRGEGPSKVSIQNADIVAEPIAKLAPRQEVTYRLVARGQRDGNQLIRVQLLSDETPAPVTKEEGTRVYADQ